MPGRRGLNASNLSAFSELIPLDRGLCVVSTVRPDGNVHSSVANAGVLAHVASKNTVVGFAAMGSSQKLRHLRADPHITVVARAGLRWAAVEGYAEIIGPDDPSPHMDDESLRQLLRGVFVAAGGTHHDWDAYDRVMVQDRRAAVLVTPRRVYTNPSR
ncbi:MAG TPA: pyridoxamine 5'-phosphate oxidase family protein [Acidimicrobiales bacterium]